MRTVASRLGELLEKPVKFAGQESETSLTGNTTKICSILGPAPAGAASSRSTDRKFWVATMIMNRLPAIQAPRSQQVKERIFIGLSEILPQTRE